MQSSKEAFSSTLSPRSSARALVSVSILVLFSQHSAGGYGLMGAVATGPPDWKDEFKALLFWISATEIVVEM